MSLSRNWCWIGIYHRPIHHLALRARRKMGRHGSRPSPTKCPNSSARASGHMQMTDSLELRTEPGKCFGLHCDVEFVRAVIEFTQVSVGLPNPIVVKGDASVSGLHDLEGK